MVYRFSGFVFDSARYELRRGGEPVAAEPQVLEVLGFLLRHRHRVVSKEELLEEVWEGRYVGDAAISRAIRQVRRALGDSGAESRFVKTVYGRGFRFVGEAEEEAGGLPAAASGGGEAPPASRPGERTGDPEAAPRPIPVPLTPLVGRERELAEVCDLLLSQRLLTLTGAAGTGKTRLALAAAAAVRDRFADGAVFVPLVDVRDADGLGSALARALGLSDAAGESTLAALAIQLRERHQLLVLDNFEQLAQTGGELADLLRECPSLVALVTSRFVLRIPGEQEYPLAPLALPEREAPPSALRESPAIALFLARARSALPSFRPDDEDLAYVTEICRRLDGLPLALELAAARVKMFTPQALWERLAGRLDLLSSPGRARAHAHRTLEEAHAWSYELLGEGERSLLRRLAVFSGGFRLEAVEEVSGLGEEEAFDLLSALVDKSLVERRVEPSGEARFQLLETTREFALERLREAGEEADVRNAHAAWALDLATQGQAALAGGDQKRWLDRLDAEYPNLVGALAWSRGGGDLTCGFRIGSALGRYWSARAAYREGSGELRELLEHPGAGSVPAAPRADGLIALGLLTHLLCDYRTASEKLGEARTILEGTADRVRLASVLVHLAWVALQSEPLDRAEALAQEAFEANDELGDRRGSAVALNNLAHIEFYRGDAEGAEERFLASLERRREAGDDRGIAFTLGNLAMVRLMLGGGLDPVDAWLEEARGLVGRLADRPLLGWIACMQARADLLRNRLADAFDQLEENAFHSRQIVHPDGAAWVHLITGDLYRAQGDLAAARRELGRAQAIWRSLGASWGEATAGLRLADLAAGEGERDEARSLLCRVLELASRFGLEGLERAGCSALEALEGAARSGRSDGEVG